MIYLHSAIELIVLYVFTFQNISMFGYLQTEKFNNVDFDSFSKSLIYKHETDVEFKGFKTYLNGIDASGRLECDELNNIPVENILKKTGAQRIKGPLHIGADVFVYSDTEISENLNNIPVEYLMNSFETIDGGYKINGGSTFFYSLVGAFLGNLFFCF